MARTEIDVITPYGGAGDLYTDAVALDPTNDMFFDANAKPLGDTMFLITNSGEEDIEVTFKAGDNPPADAAGVGDLAVTVGDLASVIVGPLESARFLQNDGTLHVDVPAAATGTILAIYTEPV